jgi:2'-5' RNA ligase
MSKKAVDVVLLPSAEIVYKVIKLNRQLVEKFGARIVLDKESPLPHVSLAMGCIEEGDTSEITDILKDIAGANPIGELRITGVRISQNARGENVSALEIERTSKLQKLHEEITRVMKPYFSYDVTEDMIYPSGEVAQSSLEWIKSYKAKSSFEKFWPHITLGYGVIDNVKFTAKMVVSKLALCWLGNHCTCRKILAAVDIERTRG